VYRTVLYSIDIGSVSVFTVQIDNALKITHTWGSIFQKLGASHTGPLRQKSQRAQSPLPVLTPMVKWVFKKQVFR